MVKKKIMITGSTGFLPFNLHRYLHEKYLLIGSYNSRLPSQQYDFLFKMFLPDEPLEMEKLLRNGDVSVIIHAAAMARPELCSEKPDQVFATNVMGTQKVANLANRYHCSLIYISSDLVYENLPGPHLEDAVSPGSVYSKSKLDGELIAIKENPDTIILRCALMYGFNDGINLCFVQKMEQSIHNGCPLKLFTDHYRSPLWAMDVAEVIELLVNHDEITGSVFNLGGPESLSRFEMGIIAADVLGWDKNIIIPVKMKDIPKMKERAENCVLDSWKIYSHLGWSGTRFRDGLEMLKEYRRK